MKKKQVVALLASTALAVSVTSGCSCSNTAVETEEPVVVEETAPVVEEEPVVEETVEEVEEAIEETVVSENTVTEEEPVVEEVQEENITAPWEIVEIDPVIMYATTTANVRSGPATTYEVVNSLSWAQQITVIAKVVYQDKEWSVLEYSNLETKEYQMVASSLLSETKPKATQPANSSSSTSNSSGNTNTSGGNTCSDCGDCPAHCNDCNDCSDCPTYTGCSDGGGVSDLPEACWDCPDGGCFDV